MNLLVVPTLGGVAPVQIAPPGAFPVARVSPDSRSATFLVAAPDTYPRYFQAQLHGAPRPRPISGEFTASVFDREQIGPHGDAFLFIADQERALVTELFVTRLGRLDWVSEPPRMR